MENIQKINLDIMNQKAFKYIYTKQFDIGRKVIFDVTENNKPFDLSNTAYIFEMKKPDGVHKLLGSIESGNILEITIDENMSALAGKFKYQITFMSNEDNVTISTVTGKIVVEPSVAQIDDFPSTSDDNIKDRLPLGSTIPDYTQLITTITSKARTYTFEEPCFLIGTIETDDDGGVAQLSLNNDFFLAETNGAGDSQNITLYLSENDVLRTGGKGIYKLRAFKLMYSAMLVTTTDFMKTKDPIAKGSFTLKDGEDTSFFVDSNGNGKFSGTLTAKDKNGEEVILGSSNDKVLTQEEYDALSMEEKMNGTSYFVPDAEDDDIMSENVIYNNSSSGLSSENVQDAIDEVNAKIKNYELLNYVKSVDISPSVTINSMDVAVVNLDENALKLDGYNLVSVVFIEPCFDHNTITFVSQAAKTTRHPTRVVLQNFGKESQTINRLEFQCLYEKI